MSYQHIFEFVVRDVGLRTVCGSSATVVYINEACQKCRTTPVGTLLIFPVVACLDAWNF